MTAPSHYIYTLHSSLAPPHRAPSLAQAVRGPSVLQSIRIGCGPFGTNLRRVPLATQGSLPVLLYLNLKKYFSIKTASLYY